MEVPAYGVKERIPSGGAIDLAVESLRLLGYAVVESGYSEAKLANLSARFAAAHELLCNRHGGRAALEAIDEQNTIRAPLALDDVFVSLATHPHVLAICERLLGSYFILNHQNGIINPPSRGRYNQGAYHRDLPYQHFVTSRPLVVNALFCLDEFTSENGATRVLPGSHKQESFPSDGAVLGLEKQIVAPAGAFIVLDGMLFHSGGVNCTAVARRAVNHVYTLPFIKQQIELPALLEGKYADDPVLSRLLDYGNEPPRNVAGYYERRRDKKSRG